MYKYKYIVSCLFGNLSVQRTMVLPLQCFSWWLCSSPRSVKHGTYIHSLDDLLNTVAWTVMPAWSCTGLSTGIYSANPVEFTLLSRISKPMNKTYTYIQNYTIHRYICTYLRTWFLRSESALRHHFETVAFRGNQEIVLHRWAPSNLICGSYLSLNSSFVFYFERVHWAPHPIQVKALPHHYA